MPMLILKKERRNHKEMDAVRVEGNFTKGFTWGIFLSAPLWLSIYGWIKIIGSFH